MAATMLYVFQVRNSVGLINHLQSFYFDPERSESAATFFLRNLQPFINLFSPIPTGSRAIAATIAMIIGACFVLLLFRRRRSAAALPALVTLGVFAAIVTASFARVYPFGGELRQQFFIFPFLVLSLVGAIDQAFVGRRTALAILALIAVGAGANCVSWWRAFSIERTELFTADFRKFATSFGTDRTVVVDQFSLIAYFSQTHQKQWRLIPGGSLERVARFDVGSDVQLLRDRSTWNYDLTQRPAFVRLHEVAGAAQKPEFTLFLLRQFPDEPASKRPDDALVVLNARLAGLATDTHRRRCEGRFRQVQDCGACSCGETSSSTTAMKR